MSQKNNTQNKSDNKNSEKRGYQPSGGNVTGGHNPEKSQRKPVNPPKKK